MMIRKLLLATAATLSLAVALPAAARTNVDFYVNVAPPAPIVEVVPVARPGWVWIPGVWEWRRHRHVWLGGHWVRARRGYYYAPAAWVQHGDRWAYHRGGWRR
jgi:YXWGXW repeat-containing protein